MHGQPVVEVTGATVRFPGDTALDHVDFRMFPGEVHSLMGENGAGKSTLIKAITGALKLDEGSIRLFGEPVRFGGPADAQRAGIRAVYQEVDLLPNLSVGENLMLGREPRRGPAIDWRALYREAGEVLAGLGLTIDPRSALGGHSLAVQQLVAIARAVSAELRVLVLDEPTSSLDQDEVAELFRVIRELRDRGVAVLFVSHFLDQVYELCDRVTVLRNGSMVGEYLTKELLRIDLVQKMLGRPLDSLPEPARAEQPLTKQAPLFSARGISRQGALARTDLQLYEGEAVGFAGLLGSGRTELARLITGIDRSDSGDIRVAGRTRRFRSPRAALAVGVSYSPENRKTQGIIADLSVRDNIAIALQAQRGWYRRLSRARQNELVTSWIEALDIRPADPDRKAGLLSGGNQQKVVLARILATAPRLLVLDEPTRGIDVGAKVEIQKLVGDLTENGMALVYISAELEEVLRVSNRVAILRDQHLVAEYPAEVLSFDSLLAIVAQAGDDE